MIHHNSSPIPERNENHDKTSEKKPAPDGMEGVRKKGGAFYNRSPASKGASAEPEAGAFCPGKTGGYPEPGIL